MTSAKLNTGSIDRDAHFRISTRSAICQEPSSRISQDLAEGSEW